VRPARFELTPLVPKTSALSIRLQALFIDKFLVSLILIRDLFKNIAYYTTFNPDIFHKNRYNPEHHMSVQYYPLINKVLGFLNLQEKMVDSGLTSDAAFERPFVTVAREPGSGGAPIAKLVAAKLGFELIDEQIIDEISNSTKKRREIIKAVDEKSRTKIEDLVHSTFNLEYMDEETYVLELVRVVLAYAYRGKTVILGRGANFITPFARGLHVNITAPYKVRVQRAMDFEGHSEARAKEVIAEVEKERKDFVKQYFRKDISKSNSYDLTINTTYFGVEQSSEVIVHAFNQKFPRNHFFRSR
jgi:cytidylate kinase